MNTNAKHIIKKQVLNISVPVSENSYNIQEQLGRICQQILPPLLEQVCNTICMEAYWIKLDKIHLDLGTLPAAGLETALSESTAKKLTEVLTTAIRMKDRKADNSHSQKRSPAAPIELLTYFLSTGTLPAWIDNRSIRLEQLVDDAMATAAVEMSRFLRHTLHKNDVYKRLAGIIRKQQFKALAVLITKTNVFEVLIDELLSSGHADRAPEQIHLLSMITSVDVYGCDRNAGFDFARGLSCGYCVKWG